MTILTRLDEHASAPANRFPLPVRAGIGLKSQHYREILESRPDIGFFEVHAENYMGAGGPFHHYLQRIGENYPLSLHGVGLSIGAEHPLDEQHLDRLADLIERYQPASFSEHLAWSSHGGLFLNDLLPLAYDDTTLARVCEHIDRVQTRLRRPMLLENPATYVEFSRSTMDEASFIGEVVRRSGCGLLLDVNNAYVSSVNHRRDAYAYIRALPLAAVAEVHLAGFAEDRDDTGARLLIDNHGAAVDAAVWQLYAQVLELIGAVPTLLERDHDVPPLALLLQEARQAERLLERQPGQTQRVPR
ncbi:MNIO family bufferin maturase [Pseudomonas sp. SP16.1]|uniref:MNIO family bufferin maturase n=1 Tax=Pseudomonas sp. SP16.1 TaxID=3458854 RepID=UPI0040463925